LIKESKQTGSNPSKKKLIVKRKTTLGWGKNKPPCGYAVGSLKTSVGVRGNKSCGWEES